MKTSPDDCQRSLFVLFVEPKVYEWIVTYRAKSNPVAYGECRFVVEAVWIKVQVKVVKVDW